MPEVIDAWFDSGSMPFAQWGYPHVEGSAAMLEQAYPADFICEAIDQTRGWFYTLMAVGTLVFEQSSYQNVLCLGHILAEDGRKMSKHLGNILEPIPLMDEHGADAVRWFMAAGGSPWAARRVGHTTIQETVRKVLLTYWNTVAFHVLYANLAGWTPGVRAPSAPSDPEATLCSDRWALSEAHRLVGEVTEAMENFDTQRAGTLLSTYVDDLSNWYVRRSRRRFWDGDTAAFATLHECLVLVTQLMAPMAPFITERVWRDVVVASSPDQPESVHLSTWPAQERSPVDADLAGQMKLARRLVELGRAARADAKVRTRQPLRRALVATTAHDRLSEELRREVAEELNVGTHRAALRRRDRPGRPHRQGQLPRARQEVRQGHASGCRGDRRRRRRGPGRGTGRPTGRVSVELDGQPIEVLPDEVIISERPREGWSVVNEHGETVALDLEVTPELRRAGLAREVIRMIQEARKAAGFEVSDRIALSWAVLDREGTGELAEALAEHRGLIAEEVLASTIAEAESPDGLAQRDPDLGIAFSVYRV